VGTISLAETEGVDRLSRALIVLGLLLSACGGESGTASSSTVPASTAPVAHEPWFLVAATDGIWRVSVGGLVEPVAEGVDAQVAYGDGSGGSVYQERAPWPNQNPIVRREAGAAVPEVLVEARDEPPETGRATALDLRGMVWPDGDAKVLYTSLTFRCGPRWAGADGAPANPLPPCDEPIHALDLVTGDDIVIGHLGGWECGAQGPVSLAGDAVVGVTAYYFDDDVQSFELGSAESCVVIDLPGPRPPAGEGWVQAEEPGRFRMAALSPDGARLAFTDTSSWSRKGDAQPVAPPAEAITTVSFVVLELDSGQEIMRVDLTDVLGDDDVVWLDYDGEHAVVSAARWEPETRLSAAARPIAVDPRGGLGRLPVSGVATIWR
jgi:hypothetical protein